MSDLEPCPRCKSTLLRVLVDAFVGRKHWEIFCSNPRCSYRYDEPYQEDEDDGDVSGGH